MKTKYFLKGREVRKKEFYLTIDIMQEIKEISCIYNPYLKQMNYYYDY